MLFLFYKRYNKIIISPYFTLSENMSHVVDEPILQETSERYTFFPIKYDDIYQIYKRQVDSFWRPEEVDLSKDLTDWNSLNDDERYFISMILPFSELKIKALG